MLRGGKMKKYISIYFALLGVCTANVGQLNDGHDHYYATAPQEHHEYGDMHEEEVYHLLMAIHELIPIIKDHVYLMNAHKKHGKKVGMTHINRSAHVGHVGDGFDNYYANAHQMHTEYGHAHQSEIEHLIPMVMQMLHLALKHSKLGHAHRSHGKEVAMTHCQRVAYAKNMLQNAMCNNKMQKCN